MLCTVVLLALFASAQGRAVNISNTWVLPEEGFPVFYRYFRDRISWYEADAVCQFHHANLVTVDTTAQYDAVRAYLKELDISSAVWVGLIRSNPNGDFTWTDYHGLSGDGYWSSAPDPRVAPLCAAADPTADYRWKARSCGGPTVASFICELPVPQWALGNEGCMVRALPALTILYLPESASVQLTADCGLAGVKRIQCTGNVKRQDLLRDLSCTEEEEATTMVSITTSGTTWSTTNESVFTDQEMTAETMNDYNVTTEQQRDNNEHSTKTSSTPPNIYINPEIQTSMKPPNPSKLNRRTDIILKHVELDLYNNNSNLHSNHIPKIANAENYLSNEQLDKIEDEKHMQHKMLHEEIARQGNLENIFTQPTDHFVPPLVMAKAKISNDMTVLSIQEKHAQQMAEHHLLQEKSQYKQYDNNLKINNVTSTTENSKVVFQSIKSKDYMKKGKNKPTMPKKYNEKVFDSKGKLQKIIETNPNHLEKLADFTVTSTESSIKYTTTYLPLVGKLDDEGDSSLNLTVLLKDAPDTQDEKSFYNYSGDISRLETMNIYSTQRNETEIRFYDLEATEQAKQEHSGIQYQNKIQNLTFSHDNVKAFTVSDVNTSTIPQDFEMSSKIPVFEAHQSINPLVTITNENTTTDATTTKTIGETTAKPFQTTVIDITADLAYSNLGNDTVDTIENDSATSKPIIKMELPIPRSTIVNKQMSEMEVKATDNNTQSGNSENTKSYDAKLNFQEELGANLNTTDAIDDYNSPLLSGANVPPHRPYRSRRPQPQPSRNKFNPFRILG